MKQSEITIRRHDTEHTIELEPGDVILLPCGMSEVSRTIDGKVVKEIRVEGV